ncbi:hypothetical protein F3Y22_tig00110114pilonHSYRG00097 [Hibiscus syriacus]|uniref:Uncharacterized protein n=1 Tax=Hibiscus syriacus TaxID=106335 RepID=A0A6A3BNM3_HIBSY|nr:hypothetical protein F3Y22_tig00110114pilonHSYRG00097 [Hibiscus syriacus]
MEDDSKLPKGNNMEREEEIRGNGLMEKLVKVKGWRHQIMAMKAKCITLKLCSMRPNLIRVVTMELH